MPKSDLQILTDFSAYAKENRHLGPLWAVYASVEGKRCLLVTLDQMLMGTGHRTEDFMTKHDINFVYFHLGGTHYYNDLLTRVDRAIARLKEKEVTETPVEQPSEELALVS